MIKCLKASHTQYQFGPQTAFGKIATVSIVLCLLSIVFPACKEDTQVAVPTTIPFSIPEEPTITAPQFNNAAATAHAETARTEALLATAVAQIATVEVNNAQITAAEATKTAEQALIQQELIQAHARELAAYAQAEQANYPQRSMLLAIEAIKATEELGQAPPGIVQDAFYDALGSIGGIGLHGHTDDITAVAISSDSHWLATGSRSSMARLWDLTAPKPGTTSLRLIGHENIINAVSISPDAHWLATASEDSTVRLWDLTSANPAANPIILRDHQYGVTTVAFSRDNRWLVTGGSDHTVRLWELAALNPNAATVVLSSHEQRIENSVISSDSHWLFTSSNDALIRWDLTALEIENSRTELPLATNADQSGYTPFPEILSVSPDGRWLAVGIYDGIDSIVQIFDLTISNLSNASITLKEGLDGWISALAFSPDGQWLAAAHAHGDQALYIWNIADHEPSEMLITLNQEDFVRSLAFSPDSQWLVSGGGDHLIQLWPVGLSSYQYIQPIILAGHEGAVGIVTFSPDNRWLISAHGDPWGQDQDYSARLWEWAKLPYFPPVPTVLDERENWVTDLLVSPDSHWLLSLDQRLCGGEDCEPPGDATAVLWDLTAVPADSPPLELFHHESYMNSAIISPDGRWLAIGGENQEVWLWDLSHPDPSTTKTILTGHESPVNYLTFTPDSRWLASISGRSWSSSYSDNAIRLWDLSTSDSLTRAPITLSGHEEMIWHAVVSDDGRWLITHSQDDMIRLWDLKADDPLQNSRAFAVPPHTISRDDNINNIAISPDSRWLVTGGEWMGNEIRLYDLELVDPADSVLILTTHESNPIDVLVDHTSVFFSQDGRWLVTGRARSQNKTHLWDLQAPDPTAAPYTLSCGNDYFIAISPDHHWVITSDDKQKVCLWDISTPENGLSPITLYDYHAPVGSIAFSSDSQHLAIGDYLHEQLYTWDLSAPNPNDTTLIVAHRAARHITFSPDGRWLAADSWWTNLYLWPLQINELIDIACQTVGRNLTQEEWYQYFDEEPYQLTCTDFPQHPTVP